MIHRTPKNGNTGATMTTDLAPLAATLPADLSAADRQRIEQAIEDSRAPNTRAQYRSAGKAWAEWSALNGHATLPAAPEAIAAYLAELADTGKAVHHPGRPGSDRRRSPRCRSGRSHGP